MNLRYRVELSQIERGELAAMSSKGFVCIDVNRHWRKVKVTDRRAAEDYAPCMRELVDVHYPDAACIRVVQDNLSTHSAGAL
jgi:hypothetical protein